MGGGLWVGLNGLAMTGIKQEKDMIILPLAFTILFFLHGPNVLPKTSEANWL